MRREGRGGVEFEKGGVGEGKGSSREWRGRMEGVER